jgi:hypothetical protein
MIGDQILIDMKPATANSGKAKSMTWRTAKGMFINLLKEERPIAPLSRKRS